MSYIMLSILSLWVFCDLYLCHLGLVLCHLGLVCFLGLVPFWVLCNLYRCLMSFMSHIMLDLLSIWVFCHLCPMSFSGLYYLYRMNIGLCVCVCVQPQDRGRLSNKSGVTRQLSGSLSRAPSSPTEVQRQRLQFTLVVMHPFTLYWLRSMLFPFILPGHHHY